MTVTYIDAREITVADSWVAPSNKVGTGNGEAKIYVGGRASQDYRDFFGDPGFQLKCRLRRSNLLRFLEEMKVEYWFPTFSYRAGDGLREIWADRYSEIDALTEECIYFSCFEQTQIEGPRGYINSDDPNYQILRNLPLPETSSLTVIKLSDDDKIFYEFRLTPDFDGLTRRSFDEEIEIELESSSPEVLPATPAPTTTERVIRARIGQQRFKRDLLSQAEAMCPFTQVKDHGLLIASHIKPWAKSDDIEKLDPQNGLVFTPTYDRLFDRGLITFMDDRTLAISPLLSKDTSNRLQIANGMEVDIPLLGGSNSKRRQYMEFHREFQFRG